MLAGPLLGATSLLWQIYDKIIARPRLVIDTADVRPRLNYAPESWNWFSNYERVAWCRPWGTVICVPVKNVGKVQATDCRAKMRFRLVEIGEDKPRFGEWSRYVELHWSDNPERDVSEAYRPISLGRNETAYADLVVYHTRSLERSLLRGSCDDVEHCNPNIATVLTFYAKPFIRGDLPDRPCGWNPPPEFFKLVAATTHDIERGFILPCYEVELLIVCSNAWAKARLYLVIARDVNSLCIYRFTNLDDAKKLPASISFTKPIYLYTKTSENEPEPL